MDNSNKDDGKKQNIEKVRLILDEIFPGENVDVPDPITVAVPVLKMY